MVHSSCLRNMVGTLASSRAACGLALFFCLLGVAHARPQSTDAQAMLRRVVDSETAESRRAIAVKLASKLELDDWLAAMREFGDFEDVEPGVQRYGPTLGVLGKKTPVELFVYVPEKYSTGTPAPLLVVGHGTGGTGRGQHEPWKAVADELGMLILSPSATGANVGYTFSEEERAETLAALRWVRRRFNIDENRIALTGVSRGGHLTWDIGTRFPDRFSLLAPMIGGPRLSNSRGENTIRYLENVAHMPIRDLQGSRDDPHLLFNLRLAFQRLESFEAPDAKLIEFPELGHSYNHHAVDWRALLESSRREARPARVVRCAARDDEARSAWVEITKFGKDVSEKFQLRVRRPQVAGDVRRGATRDHAGGRGRTDGPYRDAHARRRQLRGGRRSREGVPLVAGPLDVRGRQARLGALQPTREEGPREGIARSALEGLRGALRPDLLAGGRSARERLNSGSEPRLTASGCRRRGPWRSGSRRRSRHPRGGGCPCPGRW